MLTALQIIDARDERVSIQGYQLLVLPNMEVINVSSVNSVARDQQLVIDLGAEILIDRVYLFLDTSTPLTLTGLLARDAAVKWHVSISDPYALQSELNPRATIIDERHRLPNQDIDCVPIDAKFGLALAPRTSFSDCQCLNLAPNVSFDIQTGCQLTEIDAMPVPRFSISGAVVPSQKFSLDFYFGQPAVWSLQFFDHVIGVRDFIQVTVLDDSNRLTRVKYRLVSPPITTDTLALPNIVRTNLTVTAAWHRPGHVTSASVTQRQVNCCNDLLPDFHI